MSPISQTSVAAATHAAQRLQRVRYYGERPIRQRRRDVGPQTVAPCCRHLDGCDVVFQHNVMHRVLEAQASQSSPETASILADCSAQQKPG